MVTLDKLRIDMEKQLAFDKDIHTVEVRADTLDECLDDAAVQLDSKKNNLEYEVIERGSQGVIGLMKKPWRIRVYETPPVIRQKKEKEARKKQKTTQVKEIRLSTFIEEHDVQVKANTASKFLKDGDKVKVSLRFRGRERDFKDKGMAVMQSFAEIVSEVGVVEKKPVFEGRSLTMVLGPKADK